MKVGHDYHSIRFFLIQTQLLLLCDLKLDNSARIQMGSVYRGHEQLSDKEVLKIYSKRHLPGKCFSKIRLVFYRLHFKSLGFWFTFEKLRLLYMVRQVVSFLSCVGSKHCSIKSSCRDCRHRTWYCNSWVGQCGHSQPLSILCSSGQRTCRRL